MKRPRRGALSVAGVLGLLCFLAASEARASLTSSEKGQVRDFVASARLADADKVRSLVARTDLSAEESGEVLSAAIAAVPFTEARGAFLKEVAFGGASAPSRPVLVLAEVKALLARADAVFQRYVGGLDHEPGAVQELAAIYGWFDTTIASAGAPAGIPSATYEKCASALGEHLGSQGRWLKGDGPLPAAVGRLRAQAQVALLDMMPEGVTRWVDAANRLGFASRARRAMLTQWGLLFIDGGRLDEPKVERVRQLLERLPAARGPFEGGKRPQDPNVMYVGDEPGPALRARGAVIRLAAGSEPYPVAGVTPPADYDPSTASIAHDLAVLVTRRALRDREELRRQAERDAGAAGGDTSRFLGRPRAPSVERVVGAAVFALLTDAPRARDLALARLHDGRPHSVALLSDALGVLASFAAEEKDAKGRAVRATDLGKSDGWTRAAGIELAPNGVAVGFTVDGRTWSIERPAPSYQVLSARVEPLPVSPTKAGVGKR